MTSILTHCLEWVTLPSQASFVACVLHVFSMHKAKNSPPKQVLLQTDATSFEMKRHVTIPTHASALSEDKGMRTLCSEKGQR